MSKENQKKLFGISAIISIVLLTIAMTYAWRGGCERLLAGPLFIGGLALSLWQSKQYVNEFLGYLYSAHTNLKNGTAIAMANSDSATGGFSESVIITVWILFFAAFTLLAQWWLKNKTQGQLTRYMQIAVLASLTVCSGSQSDLKGTVGIALMK
ncbi:hypothetical protein [Limosilactobacillus mucosae]|uniref:hypothetical protein n=1 Tax=Limosilactobacillus mucosae TaxID=97478 RepID=UPI003B521899